MTIEPIRTTLYRHCRTPVTLTDVLATLNGEGWIGLVYTPNWAGLVRYIDAQLDSPDYKVEPDQVFEARFFNKEQELRWLRHLTGDRTGDAVCLTEKKQALPDWKPMGSWTDLEPLEGQYLIAGWGCPLDPLLKKGWSQVTNASIGTRSIPIAGLKVNGCCYLHYREYLGRPVGNAGNDGNCVVLEERLIGLAIPKTTTNNEKGVNT